MDDNKIKLLSRINNDFTYHAPFGDQVDRYSSIRSTVSESAKAIVLLTPVSREQSLAITHLEEAVFWANAAIARNESE